MSFSDIIDLSSDDEEINVNAVKVDLDLVGVPLQQFDHKDIIKKVEPLKYERQNSEENRSSNVLSAAQSTTSALDQVQSPVNDSSLSSTSPLCAAPLCRQFWKAGNYEDKGLASNKATLKNGKNYLHIHPMFLHSNATSHKWAFGAIAELLDNAVDEIQNGATFVVVDKITNPRNGSPALLVQDDGGGMDPEAMRCCMSFGFSEKKLKSSIGKYGNGFKTSSMRLGADVIVFSRHMNDRIMSQSIGLLSYTFLTRTNHDRIVVPMVDYKFNCSTRKLEPLCRHGKEHFTSNLSVLLQWSPYSSEAELLKQFDDIGNHGTKVIVYNLWLTDHGNVELDFDSDPAVELHSFLFFVYVSIQYLLLNISFLVIILQDIGIVGDKQKLQTLPAFKELTEQHIGNRYKDSLRVYLSILYLRIPASFRIILRGQDVEHHSIVNDLKFRELIMYRPQSGGCVEGEVVTTIGFLKEAPHVNIHGFNVYHKNRLILPFWQAVSSLGSSGRGVVGVLETNFIEPTHNKQDFERTSLFQKLETRLKEMAREYWVYHCALIGYQQVNKKPRALTNDSAQYTHHSYNQPVMVNQSPPPVIGATLHPPNNKSHTVEQSVCNLQSKYEPVSLKRLVHGSAPESGRIKRQATEGPVETNMPHSSPLEHANTTIKLKNPEAIYLMEENKKLHARCLQHEKRKEEVENKVRKLRMELGEVQRTYDRMLAESTSL